MVIRKVLGSDLGLGLKAPEAKRCKKTYDMLLEEHYELHSCTDKNVLARVSDN